VGDGAYTGAGTVVREDVPPGALAINVSPQRNLLGWVHRKRAGTAAARAAAAADQGSHVAPEDSATVPEGNASA
jgi:bifunctional UDP-N-acetylglucosamine pyrophosphorylase/glucosamine-1-phosphate N-acetyltransferase